MTAPWFLSLIEMGLILVLTHEEAVRHQHIPGSGPGEGDVFLPDLLKLLLALSFERCSYVILVQ